MPLSGKEMLRLFERNGWSRIRQSGSHMIVGKDGEREVIPMHKELKRGTEHDLLKRLAESK